MAIRLGDRKSAAILLRHLTSVPRLAWARRWRRELDPTHLSSSTVSPSDPRSWRTDPTPSCWRVSTSSGRRCTSLACWTAASSWYSARGRKGRFDRILETRKNFSPFDAELSPPYLVFIKSVTGKRTQIPNFLHGFILFLEQESLLGTDLFQLLSLVVDFLLIGPLLLLPVIQGFLQTFQLPGQTVGSTTEERGREGVDR